MININKYTMQILYSTIFVVDDLLFPNFQKTSLINVIPTAPNTRIKKWAL